MNAAKYDGDMADNVLPLRSPPLFVKLYIFVEAKVFKRYSEQFGLWRATTTYL